MAPHPSRPTWAYAALALLATSAARAPAQGVAAPKGGYPEIRDLEAAVVWDPATKTVQMTWVAAVPTGTPAFAFLVPTPTAPAVAVIKDDLIGRLVRLTAPAREVVKATLPPQFGWPSFAQAPPPEAVAVMPTPKAASPKPSDDIPHQTVPAGDPAMVAEWLTRSGYEPTPALSDWLKGYAERKWAVTAFTLGGPAAGTAAMVRMTFPAERPVFPLRAAGMPHRWSHGLKLFVVADGRYAGSVGGAPWGAATVWAGKADAATVGLPDQVGRDAAVKEWWVTEFSAPTALPDNDDVTFDKAADQTPVARPSLTAYEFEEFPPAWLMNVLIGVGVIVALFVAARYARRGRPVGPTPPATPTA